MKMGSPSFAHKRENKKVQNRRGKLKKFSLRPMATAAECSFLCTYLLCLFSADFIVDILMLVGRRKGFKVGFVISCFF